MRDFLITESAATVFQHIAFASVKFELFVQPVNTRILPPCAPARPILGINSSIKG